MSMFGDMLHTNNTIYIDYFKNYKEFTTKTGNLV